MMATQSQHTRYLIQEKHLSLHNRFVITDDAGVVHYKVNFTLLQMGDKLSLSDADGNELIRIHQKNFHLHLTYKVLSVRPGATEFQLASIRRTGHLWQHKLQISSTSGEYILQRTGGFSSDEFTLTKNGNVVAIATRDASPTKCLYWVDIIDEKAENHAFVLSMVIVLSCAQYGK